MNVYSSLLAKKHRIDAIGLVFTLFVDYLQDLIPWDVLCLKWWFRQILCHQISVPRCMPIRMLASKSICLVLFLLILVNSFLLCCRRRHHHHHRRQLHFRIFRLGSRLAMTDHLDQFFLKFKDNQRRQVLVYFRMAEFGSKAFSHSIEDSQHEESDFCFQELMVMTFKIYKETKKSFYQWLHWQASYLT